MIGQDDFIGDFLYRSTPVSIEGPLVKTSLLMNDPMEGWIGIPHGGISMGALIDLAMRLDNYPQHPEALYPLSADFRLGGASIKIGDTLQFSVRAMDKGAKGEVTTDHNPLPYLSAVLHYGKDPREVSDSSLPNFPKRADELLNGLTPLPRYRHCFVCGMERVHPGLRRNFYLREGAEKVVIASVGFETEDQDSFYRFQHQSRLHPLPIVALLDEILGWGGFFLSGSGAVTVKIDFTFHRPITSKEKLLFVGRGDRSRGKPGGRLLFWASGGAAVVHNDGSLEWVVEATGQYFGVQSLTEQMKESLLPQELTQQIFTLTPSGSGILPAPA